MSSTFSGRFIKGRETLRGFLKLKRSILRLIEKLANLELGFINHVVNLLLNKSWSVPSLQLDTLDTQQFICYLVRNKTLISQVSSVAINHDNYYLFLFK